MKIDEKKMFIQCAKKGWNFGDLANALNVSRITVYGYKKHNIRPDTLKRITQVLGCEPEDLLE